MNAVATIPRPRSFWIVAIAMLLWNLIGVAMFYLQVTMTPEAIAALPAEQRVVHDAAPSWIDIAFGVAVIGGLLASLALLFKSRFAAPLFLLSLLAMLVQFGAIYALTPAFSASGIGGLVLPVVLVAIALLELGYARRAHARGWTA